MICQIIFIVVQSFSLTIYRYFLPLKNLKQQLLGTMIKKKIGNEFADV